MNREQLACAILTEYETRLPPGQQHTLGARVEAMLRTVDALKLAVAVTPPSVVVTWGNEVGDVSGSGGGGFGSGGGVRFVQGIGWVRVGGGGGGNGR